MSAPTFTADRPFHFTIELMEIWRDRPDGLAPLTTTGPDDDKITWGEIHNEAAEKFKNREEPEITQDDRSWVAAKVLTADGNWKFHAAHAIATAVDEVFFASFPDDWIKPGSAPRRIEEGEWYPVMFHGPQLVGDLCSPPPWLLELDDGELPHLRRESGGIPVVVDATYSAEFEDVLAELEGVAAVHLNPDLPSLGVHSLDPMHGAAPVAVDGQKELLRDKVRDAVDQGAGVVVFPECAGTQEVFDDLSAWVSAAGLSVIVVGSHHHVADGRRRNTAVAVLPDGSQVTHSKFKPAKFEILDLEPNPDLLTVHLAGPWRFATVVCIDLLGGPVAARLARYGVDVVAVPAMSTTLDPFTAEVEHLVTQAQAVVVVANGPDEWVMKAGAAPERVQAYMRGRPRRDAHVDRGFAAAVPGVWVDDLDVDRTDEPPA